MMQLPLVLEFLKTHSLQDLEDLHGVCARLDSNGTKLSLNYDQFSIKSGDVLAEQCRGLIVRPLNRLSSETWKTTTVGDCELVARPLDRFYNYGDPSAAKIDWTDPTLSVVEKLDGTMIVFYWDSSKDMWCAATRSVPEADLVITANNIVHEHTFSSLFWTAFECTYSEHVDAVNDTYDFDGWIDTYFDRKKTYIFELCTPLNRIVVKYDSPRVTLLGVRETLSGHELNVYAESAWLKYVPTPKKWNASNPEELIDLVNSASPSELEGVVVIDSNFNRVKIKNAAWVLSSRAKDLFTVSKRAALEAVIQDKIDDILSSIDSDIAEKLIELKTKTLEYFASIDSSFKLIKEQSSSRKEFAKLVAERGDWSAPYFGLYDKRAEKTSHWVKEQLERGRLSQGSLELILERVLKTQ